MAIVQHSHYLLQLFNRSLPPPPEKEKGILSFRRILWVLLPPSFAFQLSMFVFYGYSPTSTGDYNLANRNCCSIVYFIYTNIFIQYSGTLRWLGFNRADTSGLKDFQALFAYCSSSQIKADDRNLIDIIHSENC
jgi:hypothetical protein